MNTTEQQQLRTQMFARVLGPFFVLVAATTVARASDMRALLSDFEANAAWPWVTGAFLLLASLVIVALHQYWRGAAAITVSLAGWVLALRALFLMAFPHAFMAAADSAIRMTALWVSVDLFIGLVGLYLTWVGWRPAPIQPVTQTETSTPELPRAA
ncbi:membrane protein [Mycobacterium numidiamassiliense]|uniref:Membrane protein n=2 Tax=Mycobacterium numidiamassiliense TaxID=1841861 RepID=A0A2U3PF65_9MYCO|nr:membrane protein [Mycobacterium numidiamassiliense]